MDKLIKGKKIFYFFTINIFAIVLFLSSSSINALTFDFFGQRIPLTPFSKSITPSMRYK